jgi:hypothetical protein
LKEKERKDYDIIASLGDRISELDKVITKQSKEIAELRMAIVITMTAV